MRYQLHNLSDISGFALENASSGEQALVLARAALTTSDADFYHYVENFAGMYLLPLGIDVGEVNKFLVIHHQDRTADLYVNDFHVNFGIRLKRDVKKGQGLTVKHFADIRSVTFPEVTFNETDTLVYVFRLGWRFGLFFDLFAAGLAAEHPPAYAKVLDVGQAELEIGGLYRRLWFYGVYELLESATKQFDEMQADGWFPFVETIPSEFDALTKAYANKFDFDNKINDIVEQFHEARIRDISDRWWKNERFADKKKLIWAGISAYLQDTEEGFVNCIKNLLTEVEGLLRSMYHEDTGRGAMNQREFLEHIAQKARSVAGSDSSLLLPKSFSEYLTRHTFGNFNVDTGDVSLSRHTASHGVASPDVYTKAHALQVILVLDQIHFFD